MQFKTTIKTLALCLVTTAFAACGEDLEKADYDRPSFSGENLPTVTTGAIIENLGTQVTAEIEATAPAETPVTEAGIVIGTAEGFSLTDEGNIVAKAALDADGKAEVTVQNLETGKTYYYRAYALTVGGIAYGETKSFVCSVMERVEDTYIDFTDPAAADAFTTVALLGEAGGQAPKFHDLSPIGLRGVYGYVSTIFDTDLLFGTKNGKYVGNTDNLITYAADFTGKSGVEVTFELLRMGVPFGAAQTSPFEVYVSEQPVTTPDELAAATPIGSGQMGAEDQIEAYSFLIPRAFNKPCYVSLRIKADRQNYGLALIGLGTSSMYPAGE